MEKEIINLESIVSTLFLMGFEHVDSVLFTYVLGKLVIDNRTLNIFEYKEKQLSSTFTDYIDFDGNIFKFKEGIALDTNISKLKNYCFSLRKIFFKNPKLLNYLCKLNIKEIIERKFDSLFGNEELELDKFNYFFSDKEKEYIKDKIELIENKINLNKR